MAVYKRGDNWYIDFFYNGKRKRESVRCSSRKLAEKALAKRRVEMAEDRYFDKKKEPPSIKFYDFCKEYLRWAKVNKAPNTYESEVVFLRKLEKEFEGKTLEQITQASIDKWKTKIKEEGLADGSVNRGLALVKIMFNKAIEWGWLKENPAKKVKFFKLNNQRVRYLMPEEVTSLLSYTPPYLKPIVIVAVHTGIRKESVLRLQWPQVNFELGIITLMETKNKRPQYIVMDETVRTLLMDLKRNGNCPYVFTKNGKSIKWIDYAFKEAVKKAGMEDFHFHDLRHTFASNLVMAGEDLNTVSELLGHQTLEMTRRYAHLSPKFKQRAVNVLDQRFGSHYPVPDTIPDTVTPSRKSVPLMS